ncbi:MAG: serine/threonine protein kinase, partial [Planctomycetota bacterium]
MSETPDSRKEPKEVSSPPLVSPSQVTVAGDSSQTINISGPSPETVSIGKSAAQTASASPAGAPPLPPSALGDSGATLALPPSAAFDSGATLPLHGNGDSGATLPLPPSAAFDSGATLPLHGNGDSGATLPLPSAGMASNATLESPSVGPTIDPVTGREIPYVSGYDILGELGRGGMGVVYKARQRKLNRLVALKMVLAGGHAGPEQLARFQIEAQAVAALQHPNIVQIYEVGESDSLPHFSLEYVDGAPLDKALAGKPQVPKDAARLLETLSHAMHFAHQHGIVHRDLKPANILVSSEGVPKITDFGLAKQLEGDSSQTKEGALMGTPSYMAPEQARGEFKDLGPAADVYSLGAMLYEMLVGRPPFLGATPFETIFQVIKEEPVPPSRLIPKLPQDIETICLKCLQKEPSKRYATAELLAEDCRRFVSGEPILSRPISPVERLWRWCRRNPRVAGLIATVASLLVV